MKRIQELFKEKANRILNVYCTAGYPRLHSTIEVMKALQEHGADIISNSVCLSAIRWLMAR